MNTFPVPGAIALGSSRALAAWIIVAAFCAVGLALTYLPLAAAMGAGCLVVLDARSALRLHAWRRHRDAIIALKLSGSELEYQTRSGAWHGGRIAAGGLVTRWLTVVRVRDDGDATRSSVLLLCADSLGADDYRRLRVYVRWRRRESASAAQAKV
jgi:hypothetical protein